MSPGMAKPIVISSQRDIAALQGIFILPLMGGRLENRSQGCTRLQIWEQAVTAVTWLTMLIVLKEENETLTEGQTRAGGSVRLKENKCLGLNEGRRVFVCCQLKRYGSSWSDFERSSALRVCLVRGSAFQRTHRSTTRRADIPQLSHPTAGYNRTRL